MILSNSEHLDKDAARVPLYPLDAAENTSASNGGNTVLREEMPSYHDEDLKAGICEVPKEQEGIGENRDEENPFARLLFWVMKVLTATHTGDCYCQESFPIGDLIDKKPSARIVQEEDLSTIPEETSIDEDEESAESVIVNNDDGSTQRQAREWHGKSFPAASGFQFFAKILHLVCWGGEVLIVTEDDHDDTLPVKDRTDLKSTNVEVAKCDSSRHLDHSGPDERALFYSHHNGIFHSIEAVMSLPHAKSLETGQTQRVRGKSNIFRLFKRKGTKAPPSYVNVPTLPQREEHPCTTILYDGSPVQPSNQFGIPGMQDSTDSSEASDASRGSLHSECLSIDRESTTAFTAGSEPFYSVASSNTSGSYPIPKYEVSYAGPLVDAFACVTDTEALYSFDESSMSTVSYTGPSSEVSYLDALGSTVISTSNVGLLQELSRLGERSKIAGLISNDVSINTRPPNEITIVGVAEKRPRRWFNWLRRGNKNKGAASNDVENEFAAVASHDGLPAVKEISPPKIQGRHVERRRSTSQELEREGIHSIGNNSNSLKGSADDDADIDTAVDAETLIPLVDFGFDESNLTSMIHALKKQDVSAGFLNFLANVAVLKGSQVPSLTYWGGDPSLSRSLNRSSDSPRACYALDCPACWNKPLPPWWCSLAETAGPRAVSCAERRAVKGKTSTRLNP